MYPCCIQDSEKGICVLFDRDSHFILDIGHVSWVSQEYHKQMVINTESIHMEVHKILIAKIKISSMWSFMHNIFTEFCWWCVLKWNYTKKRCWAVMPQLLLSASPCNLVISLWSVFFWHHSFPCNIHHSFPPIHCLLWISCCHFPHKVSHIIPLHCCPPWHLTFAFPPTISPTVSFHAITPCNVSCCHFPL